MKFLLLLCTLGVAVLIFSGCAPTKRAYIAPAPEASYDTPAVKDKEIKLVVSGYTESSKSFAIADAAINSFWLAFQMAAEDTLKRGDKYFSIYRPKMISNFDGKDLKTIEEINDVCIENMSPSGASRFINPAFTLGANKILCNVVVDMNGYLEYTSSKEKPTEYSSLDAKYVVDYMKKNELYYDGVEISDNQTLVETASGAFLNVRARWVEEYRNATK